MKLALNVIAYVFLKFSIYKPNVQFSFSEIFVLQLKPRASAAVSFHFARPPFWHIVFVLFYSVNCKMELLAMFAIRLY